MSELITMGVSLQDGARRAARARSRSPRRGSPRCSSELQSHPSVQEAVVISTCNRMEVSVVVDEPVAAETAVIGLLTQKGDLRPTELAEVMYAPRNCDAARHLFRVTAGPGVDGRSARPRSRARSSAPTSTRSRRAPPAR